MESSLIAPTTGIQQSPYEFLESLSLWVHPEARLLICFDDNCKHAISPNGSHPTNHLRDKHKISLSRRKGLRKVLATLDLKNPDQAAPLADGSLEDKKLRSYDGFSCLHCKYRTINLTLIIQHYSQDLPNYPQHPRRFSRKADIETYFEYVYLQTWASGASRAYWIVNAMADWRKRTRPSLNRRKVVKIQDDEPSDDSIRVNQNSAPAQANGQYEARLSTSKSNSKAAEPNTCLRQSHHLPSRLVHDTLWSTIRHSGESEEHTTASFAESRMAPSAKRQKTDDVQSRLSQTSGLLGWNALVPSGNESKKSLKATSTALALSIKSFEQLLTSINDEHSRLTAVRGSLSSQRDDLAKDQRKAEDVLQDVKTSTVTENQMLRDLEDVYNKYPGDKELLIFLEKRKKTSDEHQEVYTIVKSQLDKSSDRLSKTESELALVTGRLSQLEAERAEAMKEKEEVDKAAKQLVVMSRFLEPG
ncbi:hypothetical protein BFJ63_vAg16753 [Fusarium oxysporum f. sp. narcissi]|uniref:C2H2-type domain-containing protein n=1 Tax=Fusarium oxysporum f. sp. narcissi TaxID=451672 RepID=A0A4Q2V837_FUSOX|nr:hypothetical protein BFJ63_vAg16753 [Fusarium oxysporum f. sp. narcissi]